MFIGITAFESKDNVLKQIDNLYSRNNIYYIHYNKRNVLKHPFKYLNLKRIIKNKYDNVHIFTKYKVYWGDFSIVKSVINLQKIFIKTNEEIFLHLDQKTICLENIEKIENIISNNLNKGINFFDFNREELYKQESCIGINKKWGIGARQYFPDLFYRRKWYKNTIPQNSKFYKLNRKIILLFSLLKWIFSNPKYLSFSITKIIRNFFKNNYSYMNEVDNISAILSNKNSKIPKELRKLDFNFYTIVGPFVCMKRSDVEKISLIRSNQNYKIIKKLYKFSKNKYLTDEMYFSTLYLNLVVNKNKDNSTSLISYWDINNIHDWNYFKENIYSKNILFIRRVIGNNIDLIELDY